MSSIDENKTLPYDVLRVSGSPSMRELMDAWIPEFRRRQPDIHFVLDLKGTPTAQFTLQSGTADLALSARQSSTYEEYGFIRRSQFLSKEIPVAIGSHDSIGKAAALAIYVHEDNPIAGLSVRELDGIFGDQRSGGWHGRIAWDGESARGPEGNIRRWGDLGLTGEWADAPIVPYTPPALHPGGVSYFQRRVMGGADTVNPKTREYPYSDGLIAQLADDRFGIGYGSLGYAQPGVRAVPLSDGGPHVALTEQSVADLSYPLTRLAYIYVTPDTVVGDAAPMSGSLLAFMQFALGSEGQALIGSTDYHPLPQEVAAEQRADLTNPGNLIGTES
ncbi:MAG TPA: substrate-binding domain-containing protein [Leifsonia sp.]|nr:substrate-binding domain-containing protein [Leifsonia sp.]